MSAQHPFQPLALDEQGVMRFKKNAIVEYLLDWCATRNGCAGYNKVDVSGPAPDMNEIARMPFSREDRVQLAQLVGYSLSGFADLGYVGDVDFAAAQVEHETASNARCIALQDQLNEAREKMREGLAVLYEKHPDDFVVDE